MQIRRATTKDAELLSTLSTDVQKRHADALPQFFKEPSSETFLLSSSLEMLATPTNYVYIGEVDREAVGFIHAQIQDIPENPFRDARRQIIIHHISIKPEHQTKGYGEQLIDAVKTLAQENQIETILLDVWAFNHSAQSFFKKQGFTVLKERMWLESK